jgi:tetratricopeptide (TPR) repeat protein
MGRPTLFIWISFIIFWNASSSLAQKAEKLYIEGIKLYQAGNYSKSIDKFLDAIEKNYPDKALINYALGNAYQFWEKPEQSIRHYEKALFFSDSNRTEICYQVSTVYFNMRNYEKSIDYCNRILEKDSLTTDKRIYSRLNIIYSILGQPEKAKAIIIRGAQAGILEFQTNCIRRGITWKNKQ